MKILDLDFEIILKDISKITNLEIENIKNILNDYDFNAENLDKVIIENILRIAILEK